MSDDINKVLSADEQDTQLSKTGDASLYQRIRVLTHEERATLDALLAGGNIAEFVTIHGKPRKPLRDLQAKLPDIMDRLGLTDEHLIEKRLKPLLSANETKFLTASYKGDLTVEKHTVQANDIRLRALDMAFKLRGSYQDSDDARHERRGEINVHIVNVGA